MNQKTTLTASEISQIWGAYMNASLMVAVLSYFHQIAADDEIRPLIQETLAKVRQHKQEQAYLLKYEGYSVPRGFTEKDVCLDAPRLYTDTYLLENILLLAEFAMNATTLAIGKSTREDVYSFFVKTLHDFSEMHRKILTVSLKKGVYTRSPTIPFEKETEFVKKQNFLYGWFGEQRPLLGIEISHLHDNIRRNALGKATLIGFSQVAESKEVKNYMLRGIAIAEKQISVFSQILKDNNVPVPMGSDALVTDYNGASPFSDGLMMYHTTGMISQSIGFYGLGISMATRKDLTATYTRLMAEILLYSEDGANIMINNGWMEQPPLMVDRDKLIKRKKEDK